MNTHTLITGIGLALLLAGCPLLDKDDAGGGESGPPGGGSGVFPEDVAAGDGLDPGPSGVLVETLYGAAAACGWQSVKSVPGGWQPILVSLDGCTQWIPSNWTILGQAGNAGFSPTAGRRTYAFTLVNPLPSGYAWDADAAIDFVAESIGVEFGEDPPSILWRKVTDVADLQVADAAFAFFLEDEPVAGSLRIHFGGCAPGSSGACFALVMGYWLPVDDLVGDAICDLTQIDASLQCPGLGECVEPLCSSWCIHGGAKGGGCSGAVCDCL
ncbi:MAG: hypothetical protein ABIK09_07320 [Pseudomonadota bacterium]